MRLKYFALLILFILNFSANVFAESIHLDLPVEVQHEHIDGSDSQQTNDQHCDDHVCCHLSHFHYYLLPVIDLALNTFSTLYTFPEYLRPLPTNTIDIIKPPLV